MKLKLIKDSEVVVSKTEYEFLKSSINAIRKIAYSVRSKTASYRIFDYENMCIVAITHGKKYIAIKKFDTDDQEYNRVCAEELVELLYQE